MLLASSLPYRPVAQVPLESKPSAREAGPSLAAPKHAKKGAVAPVVGRVPITVAQRLQKRKRSGVEHQSGAAKCRRLGVTVAPRSLATKRPADGPPREVLPQATAQVEAPVGLTKRRKRARIGSKFASQADLEAAKRAREVDELVAILPERVATELLGGELGRAQLPCPEERLVVLKSAVAHKAGPDGATLGAAVRAWVAYKSYAQGRGLPNEGLPGSAALVAAFLVAEGKRAAEGQGRQGGTTVANSRRVGLLWLSQKLGFPLAVDNIVVESVANAKQLRAHRRADPVGRRRKQAGSLPIRAFAQFETLANGRLESPVRFFARSMCSFSLVMSVRAVDALRTVEEADEEPEKVISGWSYFSKDGEPMRTFAPAEGFLGPFKWWPQHRAAVRRAGRPFPMWTLPWGAKGSVLRATGKPLPFVMPKQHLVASIKACLMCKPLSLTEAAFDELGLTAHSEHGTPSDMAVTLGPHSQFGAFIREDVRELGHWLRLGCLEEDLEGGTAGAQGRRRGVGRGRQATGAFGDDAAECAALYAQGDGREGRRTAQLRVRRRWIAAVRKALERFGRPWLQLPAGRADYCILKDEEAQE